MFDLDLTPEQRLEEYHRIRRELFLLKKRGLSALLSLKTNSFSEHRALHSLYKRRMKSIRKSMVKDCYRCYGTGTPMALQIDLELYFPRCEECGRPNKK